jgi:small subunit ribosomal protein S6
MREYELMFVADPRLTDEEVVGLSQDFQKMITDKGGIIAKEESWGKRRLAYPIQKLNEGYYVLLRVQSEDGSPFEIVRQRMQQSDSVLRYLVVRMDAGRLRQRGEAEQAASRGVDSGSGSSTPPTRGSEEES